MQENLTQRQKNQRETWNAIHEAAYSLVVHHKSPTVTVEEIAAAAGVSRRTFFNYFPTKEDAILGTKLPDVTDEIVKSYTRSEADELTRVVHLFLTVLRTSLPGEGMARRKVAVQAMPSLRTRLGHLLSEIEHLVREVLLTSHSDLSSDDEDLDVLLLLAMSITRHAMARYQDENREIEPLLTHSIAAFRKVVDQTR